MSAVTISVVVFACVFGGALLGIFVHSLLPDEQISSEAKDVVRQVMGPVAMMVSLVLGLLVSSAKTFYDTQNTEVTQVVLVRTGRLRCHLPDHSDVPALQWTDSSLRRSLACGPGTTRTVTRHRGSRSRDPTLFWESAFSCRVPAHQQRNRDGNVQNPCSSFQAC